MSLVHHFEQEFDSVFVIESLRSGDLRTGENLLANFISPHGRRKKLRVEPAPRRCFGRDDLFRELRDIASVAVRENLSPILQLDCHGSEHTLELSNGDIVTWSDVALELANINRASCNSLFVVVSACHGAHVFKGLTRAYRLPLQHPNRGRAPLWGFVGPTGDVEAGQLQESLEAFYMHLIARENTDDALAALEPIKPYFGYAERIFAVAFRRYVDENLDPDKLDARVEEVHAMAGAPRDAIRLRMTDFERDFHTMRNRYLWLDEFPSIADRFRLTFANVVAASI